jgi:hypothetical protein
VLQRKDRNNFCGGYRFGSGPTKRMKEQRFPLLYGLVALICMVYFILDEVSISSPSEPHRRLITRQNTCTSKMCPSLFFLSGIYDLVNFNIRFTEPFEDHDPTTLFAQASFSESAVARVKKFSSFEFYLSSNLDHTKNSVSGSYISQHLVNGSAIVVVSEFPGKEMWFHSDSTMSASCLNRTTSLIVFANALNFDLNLFTRTPEGVCQKIERENEDSSPLTYCQARGGFVWEIFTDWRCSTQRIASDYVSGGLGTVYSVIIGDNVSTASLVTISAHSSFDGMNTFQEKTKSHPSFFQRNMLTLVLSIGLGSLLILLLFCLGSKCGKPSVAGFREGDIVVYQLTRHQLNNLRHNDPQILKTKTKGFGLIVKSPPIGLFDEIVSRWSWPQPSVPPKSVLLLQPLKKIMRSELQTSDDRKRPILPPASLPLELSVDDVEAPLSINQSGFRGARVLIIIPTNKILRKCIFFGPSPPQKRTSVRFSDQPDLEASIDTAMLIWMESLETECLLPTRKASESPIRNRKAKDQVPFLDSDVAEEKDDGESSALVRLWRGFLGSKAKPNLESLGSGWIFSSGDDGYTMSEEPANPNQPVQPFLQSSGIRYEATSSESSETLPPGVGYSYLLQDFPLEEIPHIYCREWDYPLTETVPRTKKSVRHLSQPEPPMQPQVPAKESPKPLPKESRKSMKAVGQSGDLLNLLIEEHGSPLQKGGDSESIHSPDVSRFVASPQPVSVRIAMRRELSRKTKILSSPNVGIDSPPPVFTAPRLMITSPLPQIGAEELHVEEISSPMSPVRSYFVTPPRIESFKNRKSIRQLSVDLHSQTNKKSKKESTLISPNSSPLLNPGNSINSSTATIPASHMTVNADREVSTGFGSLDRVRTGSKLEIDDLENENEEYLAARTKSRKYGTSQVSTSRQSSEKKLSVRPTTISPTSLPPVVVSPRHPSASNSFSNSPTFTASPKTLPLRNSPRKTLSARNASKSPTPIRGDGMLNERSSPTRASSRFDMDLSFLPDDIDD